MLNQHSLEEIAEIYNLLGDIKKEYKAGIKPILMQNSSKLYYIKIGFKPALNQF